MVKLLWTAAVALVAVGAAAIFDGYDIMMTEKGSARVIAGTVALSAGFVLMGLAAALGELRRLRADLSVPRPAAAAPVAPPPVVAAAPAAAAPEPAQPGPPAEPSAIVGTYASGGNTYVMYADGSIQAETPTGHYRFQTIDELKTFVAEGGESVSKTG